WSTAVHYSAPALVNIRQISYPVHTGKSIIEGGAVGLSVLTQPSLFNGSPEYFSEIRRQVNAPLLMKDIIVDKIQIDAAAKLGADIILLIQGIFDKNFAGEIDE